MFAASRGGIKHFIVGREIEAPGIATAGRYLFDCAAVGFEANHAGSDASEVFAGSGAWRAGAVTDGAVNPAIHAAAEIVDDRMRVEGAEAGVEQDAFALHVALAVAVRVAQPKNVRSLRNDHAVLV